MPNHCLDFSLTTTKELIWILPKADKYCRGCFVSKPMSYFHLHFLCDSLRIIRPCSFLIHRDSSDQLFLSRLIHHCVLLNSRARQLDVSHSTAISITFDMTFPASRKSLHRMMDFWTISYITNIIVLFIIIDRLGSNGIFMFFLVFLLFIFFFCEINLFLDFQSIRLLSIVKMNPLKFKICFFFREIPRWASACWKRFSSSPRFVAVSANFFVPFFCFLFFCCRVIAIGNFELHIGIVERCGYLYFKVN